MAEPFISADDLGVYLQRTLTGDPLAVRAVIEASDAVRNYCGQPLNYTTDHTDLVDGTGTDVLLIPHLPVVSLDAVEVNGAGVTDFALGVGGLLYRTAGVWPKGPLNVAIHYDFGFRVIPDDIQLVTKQVAGRIYAAGAVIDGSSQIGQLLTLERGTLDAYRTRGIGHGFWHEQPEVVSGSSSSSAASS